jgi:hypothetical protein
VGAQGFTKSVEQLPWHSAPACQVLAACLYANRVYVVLTMLTYCTVCSVLVLSWQAAACLISMCAFHTCS